MKTIKDLKTITGTSGEESVYHVIGRVKTAQVAFRMFPADRHLNWALHGNVMIKVRIRFQFDDTTAHKATFPLLMKEGAGAYHSSITRSVGVEVPVTTLSLNQLVDDMSWWIGPKFVDNILWILSNKVFTDDSEMDLTPSELELILKKCQEEILIEGAQTILDHHHAAIGV